MADTLPQAEVHVAIERAAKAAIEKLGTFTPDAVAPSHRFEIGFQNVTQADLASIIPGSARLDSRTLGYTAATFPEGYRPEHEQDHAISWLWIFDPRRYRADGCCGGKTSRFWTGSGSLAGRRASSSGRT